MSEFDWNKLGISISELVQEAIETQDYDKLNRNINKVVEQALNGVGSIVRDAGQAAGHAVDEAVRNTAQSWQENHTREKDPHQDILKKPVQSRQPGQSRRPVPNHPVLFVNVKGSRIGGMLQAVAGYGLTVLFSPFFLFFLLGALLGSWAGIQGWISAAVYFALTAGALTLGIRGNLRFFLARRFQSYVRVLGGRSFCDLQELAAAIGKNLEFVKKDVRRMIEKNWFLEGHLDRQETCLIVTNDMYQQYLQAEEQRLIRQQQEKQLAEEQEAVPVQVQDVLEAGNAYIRRIRKCNEAIPGEDISAKIDRTEQLIQQIFARIKEYPEMVSDIRRLMEYYLPATVKLLDAYAQLDTQPVQGEHITSSKREIEAALDTLNTAFEKLLDSLFRDMAWDVSTDITVLETMLAQEGLVNDELRGNHRA